MSDNSAMALVVLVLAAFVLVAGVTICVCASGAYQSFVSGDIAAGLVMVFVALLVIVMVGGTALEFIAPAL